jgi:hypothetical protein
MTPGSFGSSPSRTECFIARRRVFYRIGSNDRIVEVTPDWDEFTREQPKELQTLAQDLEQAQPSR